MSPGVCPAPSPLAHVFFRPDRWFTSVSVYDGSTTVIDGIPTIIAAGLTPNSTSVFCHGRATPANLSDPWLVDWVWDEEPLYCGSSQNKLRPFDAPTSAWKTTLDQWMYQDGAGGVYVSDDGKEWRGAVGTFDHGMVTDFFPLPPVCAGCGDDRSQAGSVTTPTHVHEWANTYRFNVLTPGTKKDEAGSTAWVSDGGATVVNASGLGVRLVCDHGTFGFPKTFWDPVNNRRLQYGWSMNGAFVGQEDSYLVDAFTGRNISLKGNHQSLLREVTYDPRLGQLYFSPVQELALLRKEVLGQLDTPTEIPMAGAPHVGGVLSIDTPRLLANQSEIRVSFSIPTKAVTFGVRAMAALDVAACARTGVCPPRDLFSPGEAFSFGFIPPSAGSKAWSVVAGGAADRTTHVPQGPGSSMMAMLSTDNQIDLVLYVDHVRVEAYYMNGRYANTQAVQPASFLVSTRGDGSGRVVGNNTWQGVEIFANDTGVTVLNATVWRMGDAYADVATHDRPNHNPLVRPQV